MRTINAIYENKLHEVRVMIKHEGGDFDMELSQEVYDSLWKAAESEHARTKEAVAANLRDERRRQ